MNIKHKRIVEAGGGIYVPGMLGNLVMFTSKTTGSTLALPETELTKEAVFAHIMESDTTFRESSK